MSGPCGMHNDYPENMVHICHYRVYRAYVFRQNEVINVQGKLKTRLHSSTVRSSTHSEGLCGSTRILTHFNTIYLTDWILETFSAHF